MVMELEVLDNPVDKHGGGRYAVQQSGCNPASKCGNGMEKIYPTCAVRYGYMGHIGEFRYSPGTIFSCGGKVIIQTNRGMELGEQVSLTCTGCDKSISRENVVKYARNSGPDFYQFKAGRLLRAATPQDIAEAEHLNRDAAIKLIQVREIAAELNLNMKFVTAEHLLGGERLIFHFMSEDRVDFRELVGLLAKEHHTRIEMHQVGARDEARLVADYEICGRECCCKNFLKKLRQVNMKMAKLQKATLDPSKVSGRCGRLRCCLRYEHEGYEEMNKGLPRNGSRIRTERGIATVKDRQILTQLLMIQYDDAIERETIGIEDVLERGLPRLPPPQERPPAQGDTRGNARGAPAGRDRRPARGDARPARGRRDDGDKRKSGPGKDSTSERPRGDRSDRPRDEPKRERPPGPPTESPGADAKPTDRPADGGDAGAPEQSGRRRGRRGRGRRGRRKPDGPPKDGGQSDSGI